MDFLEEDEEPEAFDYWAEFRANKDAAIKKLYEGPYYPNIEDDDPYFVKLNKLRQYYNIEIPEIIAHHESGQKSFYNSYPYDWSLIFTPIERMAWEAIRRYGRIVLYPQFPVERFHLDFGNPGLKIGLELDGLAYHDPVKDFERDRELKKLGWKIYRITGREMNIINHALYDEYETVRDAEMALKEFMLHTGDGVIYALRIAYFGNTPAVPTVWEYSSEDYVDQLMEFMKQLCYESLRTHTNYYKIQ